MTLLSFFARMGAGGLFLLGVLDSSFLFLPLGNDLLLVVLTARHHDRLSFYIPMAAAGSTAGVFLLDLVCRKGGEEGLKKMIAPKRLAYFKKKIADQGAVALMVAALAPPPFPFTAVVASASAFEYPRWKLLTVIMLTRLARFTIVGLLAVWFGRRILALAQKPAVEIGMGIFIGICAVGSAISIYGWVSRSKRK